MKTSLGMFAAVIAVCCALVVGSVAQARAAAGDTCTTQGALALALCDVLGIEVTAAQAAADALAALGVKPSLGWDVDACLTEEASFQISRSYAALDRDLGGFDRAMGMILRIPDQQYPTKGGPAVSPSNP